MLDYYFKIFFYFIIYCKRNIGVIFNEICKKGEELRDIFFFEIYLVFVND